MRDSSPELDRECPAPYDSSSATCCPRRARASAVHAPNTPAPTTTTSYAFMLIAPVSYPTENKAARTTSIRSQCEVRNPACFLMDGKTSTFSRLPLPPSTPPNAPAARATHHASDPDAAALR